MLTLEEMLIRFAVAIILGALIGFERELIGKEAGVRTMMLVSSGAAIFAMISLVLPFLVLEDVAGTTIAITTDFSRVVANIVVGVGFLGAGIIIKTEEKVRGVTTSALVWAAAAIGTLVGVGLLKFAIIAGVAMSLLLYLLRGANIVKEK